MDVTTFLRVNINGKWTNLGLVADEAEIIEHFRFVEDLLQQKQRADQLEKRWNELKEKLNGVFEKNETHFLEDMTYSDVLEMMNVLEEKMC